MIHRTYRRLDEATRLAGFTLMQWTGLIAGGGSFGFLLHVLGVPTRPAVTLWTLLVGSPAALAFLSEGGRVPVATVVRDLLRWRTRPTRLQAGAAPAAQGLFLAENTDSEREAQ